ncbi:Arylsulfatase A [Arenibacter nanhaiticus]|uniref:Arylsulfatase A n=1 Tax=Arenibacter nanhaiticus TaxID=558155 RepID=A0A1M6ITN2_9FLAO|nr:sulfatase-like hydrolase/transferase [Arenibacter nanhaiticus]SHJ37785.1 Arylsulfatase A [Arenibacter nanhaiticus]
MIRNFFLLFCVGILLSSCKNGNSRKDIVENGQNTGKPNIIFLFSDDQSFKDVHKLGNPEVQTPTMDKFVTEGTTFTHAYNMGGWNGAICVASRAMIISGRSLWRAQQISHQYAQNLELDKTWPRLMQTAGYDTYMTGKWHVEAKPKDIFNYVGHVLRGMPHDTAEGYNRPQSVHDTIWKPWKKEFGGYWQGGRHWSELVKDDAVAFLDSAAIRKKPFFMYVAFNAPHDPRQAPKEYVDRYPLENIKVPDSYMALYPYAETMGAGPDLRDEKLAPFPRTEYAVKVNKQEYYAITSHLDDQLKDIMMALEQSGQKENTYIFYSSDHGLACGEHGLMGKQNMYDHSVRVPLMVIGPDIPANKKVDSDIYLQDVMATALDLAGVEKPTYVEFNSLMELVKNSGSKAEYDGIYGAYEKASQRMIRKDGYKLIVYPKSGIILLYNLKKDPQELNNIAEVPENAAQIKLLFKELMLLQEKMGDQLDLKPIYDLI